MATAAPWLNLHAIGSQCVLSCSSCSNIVAAGHTSNLHEICTEGVRCGACVDLKHNTLVSVHLLMYSRLLLNIVDLCYPKLGDLTWNDTAVTCKSSMILTQPLTLGGTPCGGENQDVQHARSSLASSELHGTVPCRASATRMRRLCQRDLQAARPRPKHLSRAGQDLGPSKVARIETPPCGQLDAALPALTGTGRRPPHLNITCFA